MTAIRIVAIALAITMGAGTPLHAGNQLEVIQTLAEPCEPYGGGTAVAVSPDGAHVYEGSFDHATQFGGTLFVSSRNAGTGALTLVQTIGGLGADPHDIVVSPDGAHVYVRSFYALYIYARDAGTGMLALVDTLAVVGLGLAISPDGATVYAGETGARLNVYARNAGSGLLTLVEQEDVGDSQPFDAVVTADGAYVYVVRPIGTFAFDNEIDIYARDLVTGALTAAGSVSLTGYPRRMAISPDDMNLYLLTQRGPGDLLRVFTRDAGTGALTLIDTESSADPGLSFLDGVYDLTVSADGAQVYVASTQATPFTFGTVNGRVSGAALLRFSRSAVDGSLTFASAYQDGTAAVPDGLGSITGLALSPDDAHLYTVGEGTVTLARSNVDGSLTFLANREAAGSGRAVLVSPDDAHAYRLCDRAIATLERDAASGLLTQAGSISLGVEVDQANTFVMSPDGKHVYVLERDNTLHTEAALNGRLTVLGRDAVSGALTLVTSYPEADFGLAWTDEIAVSPDGLNLYLVADATLLVFSRDATTGLLTLLEAQQDGGGVSGMEFAISVAVSPDGKHVYVGSGGVVSFDRSPVTGALTFHAHLPAGGGGGGALQPADDVLVTADGASFYGFDQFPPTMVGYTRDAGTGDLALGSVVEGDAFDDPGSQGPFAFAANPDGAYVYVAVPEGSSNTLYVFRRDLDTGALKQVQALPGIPSVLPTLPFQPGGDVLAFDTGGDHLYTLTGGGDLLVLARQDPCGPVRVPGCQLADTSTLKVLSKLGPKDVIAWKWKGSAAFAAGDPTMTTSFALCVYDASANVQPRISNEVAPGGTCGMKPCWSSLPTGFKYANKLAVPDGIAKLKLTTTAPGKIVAKGKGGGLPLLGLPYTSPVTVQLRATNGECWQADYATPVLSDALQYKATQ